MVNGSEEAKSRLVWVVQNQEPRCRVKCSSNLFVLLDTSLFILKDKSTPGTSVVQTISFCQDRKNIFLACCNGELSAAAVTNHDQGDCEEGGRAIIDTRRTRATPSGRAECAIIDVLSRSLMSAWHAISPQSVVTHLEEEIATAKLQRPSVPARIVN